MSTSRKRLGILISGRGTNMQAILAATRDKAYPAEIVIVVSDNVKAHGLQTAAKAGIASIAILRNSHANTQAHETAILETLDAHRVDIVCLAGFMRILSDDFVNRFAGRLLNIHPSLLPQYKGLNTHARVLADGALHHGCSVHFVNAKMDGGEVIARSSVEVLPDDDQASLAARVLQAEYKLYPRVIQAVAEGRIILINGNVKHT